MIVGPVSYTLNNQCFIYSYQLFVLSSLHLNQAKEIAHRPIMCGLVTNEHLTML